jgi:hypothetical protein
MTMLYTSDLFPENSATSNQDGPDLQALISVIKWQKPRVVVDLGTRLGGTTLAICDQLYKNALKEKDREATVLSFDIANRTMHKEGDFSLAISEHDQVLIHEHCARFWMFDHYFDRVHPLLLRMDFLLWASAIQEFVNEIRGQWSEGPMLLYVDGIAKVDEFIAYKDLLRPGDVMGMHDYHISYEVAVASERPDMVPLSPEEVPEIVACEYKVRFWRVP